MAYVNNLLVLVLLLAAIFLPLLKPAALAREQQALQMVILTAVLLAQVLNTTMLPEPLSLLGLLLLPLLPLLVGQEEVVRA